MLKFPDLAKKSETNDRMFQVNVKVQQFFIKFAPHKKTVPTSYGFRGLGRGKSGCFLTYFFLHLISHSGDTPS